MGLVMLLPLLLLHCQCQLLPPHPALSPSGGLDYNKAVGEESPEFLPTATEVSVREGAMAVLPCAVRLLGSTEVVWSKGRSPDGQILTVGTFTWAHDNIMVEYHREPNFVSHWNLLIKKVTRDHAGIYECQITAKGRLVRYVTLSVGGPPLSEPGIAVTGKEYVEKNEKIVLTCNATGGSRIPEDVDWFKDGAKVDTRASNHVVITKFRVLEQQALVSTLSIDHARVRDTGTYICRSSDKEIDSIKVTVLVADTVNVKRDKPEGTDAEELESDASSAASAEYPPVSQLVLASWALLLSSALVT